MAKKLDKKTKKDGQKWGKEIQKLIGDKRFIFIVEDGDYLTNVSNITNRAESIGFLDMTKHDYLTDERP